MKIHTPKVSSVLSLLALLLAINFDPPTAFAQGTAFTYDGLLQKGGLAQSGTFDFTFTPYSAATGGNALATSITLTGVAVKTGAFTVTLDFGGAVWNGQTVWLDIQVQGNGDPTPVPLTPRQQIMPTPYAIYAETANSVSGTLSFSQLTGTIDNSQLANSSITVSTGSGLSASPSPVALGGKLTLDNTGVTSLTGGDGVTISAATGDLTLGLGNTLTLTGTLPVSINTQSGSLLYADNNGNYFTGIGAGYPLTTGSDNTGSGFNALQSLTSGSENTAFGVAALQNNADGSGNTGVGENALQNNSEGTGNTASGLNALFNNLSGSQNTAAGVDALFDNENGSYNTAYGMYALFDNDSGSYNTATGNNALQKDSASYNVADGADALQNNYGGANNTAVGYSALSQIGGGPGYGGTNNIAIGYQAGNAFTANESSNIDIGNVGVAGESYVTRIGDHQTVAYIAGIITGNGSGLTSLNASQLTSGTINSSLLASSPITVSTTGAGLSISGSPVALGGMITLNNTGVTSLTGSDGVTVSSSTGGVTLGLGSYLTLAGPDQVGINTPIGSVLYFDYNNDNYFAGFQAGNKATTGTINTATGDAALQFNTAGTANSAYGYTALGHNTSGSGNTAVGTGALYGNTTGGENVAVGHAALLVNNGSGNTATGSSALQNNTSASDNTADGYQALYANTTGYNNTADGYQALYANTNGFYNTADGYLALTANTDGFGNTACGWESLIANTDGWYDTGIGIWALQANTTGNNNTAVGYDALGGNTTGNENTAFGVHANLYNTIGSNNVAVGYWTLNYCTGGCSNIAVGYEAGINFTGSESGNIDIGNPGKPGDYNVTRIGTPGIQSTTSLAGICNSHEGYGCLPGTAGTVFGNTFNFWWTNNTLQSWIDDVNVGNVTLTVSDRRVKEDIQPMTDEALTRVMALKPSTFKYKTIPGTVFHGDGQTKEGFIADELQQVIPSAVNGEKDALTSKGTIQPQTLNLMPVVAVLTKAVQDQQKEIDELKAMVKTLSERK